MRNRSGFTLLEVLIALAILAISATAIIRQTGNNLSQLSTLENKTVAALMAESTIDKLLASESFPEIGRSTERVTFNASEWQINIAVTSTSEPWLRKVTVGVSQGANPDYVLVSLTSFRGRY